MNELLPCTFCGAMPKVVISSIKNLGAYDSPYINIRAYCERCFVEKTTIERVNALSRPEDFISAIEKAHREVVAMWNRRCEVEETPSE